jgi:hypothetical protein
MNLPWDHRKSVAAAFFCSVMFDTGVGSEMVRGLQPAQGVIPSRD